MSLERQIDKSFDKAGDAMEKGAIDFFSVAGKGVKNLYYDRKIRRKFGIKVIILGIISMLLEYYGRQNSWSELPILNSLYKVPYLGMPIAILCFIFGVLLLLYLAGSAEDKEKNKFQKAFEQAGLYSKRKIVGADNKPQQEFPLLLRETTRADGERVVIIKNVGIPLKKWKDSIEALEASLELEINELKAHKSNPGYIEIKFGGSKLEDMIRFEEKMFNNLPHPKVYIGEAKEDRVLLDFSSTPHLLVGGSTGSGKSVVARFVAYQGVKVLKGNLWAIDFKGGLEFGPFEKIGVKVCWEVQEAAKLMQVLLTEMKARLALYKEKGVKNIDEYNEHFPKQELKRCFIAVDELAELMDYKGVPEEEKPYFEFIEAATKSIARLGRAPGIHLILATQRPSADIVDGQIKNNVTGRLCGYFRDPGAYRIVLGHQDVNLDDHKGRFIFSLGNKDTTIQAPFFKDSDIDTSLSVDYSKGMLVDAISLNDDEDRMPSVPSRVSKKLDNIDF